MKANKMQLCAALSAFINQRSGIDFRNYQSGDWKASRESFMGDYRPMLRHGKQARQLLRQIELRDCITAQDLIAATSAYSGRLQFAENGKGVYVDYTTGQYFPTEYRKAACAVLAQCLWNYARSNQEPDVRKWARQQFGRSIAQTWFN